MTTRKLLNITFTVMTLLTLLIASSAIAAEIQDQAATTTETVASMQKININQADAKTLATLNGIGKDRALTIIEYRETNGPFQKIEDIMKVKGIGRKLFDRNKDAISV